MASLLIHEPPLVISPSLACAIGLNEAIILQQVHYWLAHPKAGSTYGREKDGRRWVYNNYEEWHRNFPFWSVSTIKRAMYSLERKQLLITEVEVDASAPGGKRKWYSINYEKVPQTGSGQNDTTVVSEWHDGSGQNDTSYNIESETTSETTILAEPPAPHKNGKRPGVKSLPRGSKRTPVSSERMNPMKDAIALAFGWSWERMTPSETGQIQKTARELCLVDATPDDVPRLMAYCRSKFDHFKPPALAANYTNAMKWAGWRAPDKHDHEPTASEMAMAHVLDAMEAGDERDAADTLAA